MGNSASGETGEDFRREEEDDDYAKQFDGIETLGYRVLGVQPDSPASEAGLVSFFDFIVGANQLMLLGSGAGLEEGEEYDDVDFPGLLRQNLRKPVDLLVYNIKAREKRVVQLTPSDDWGGAGLLGVTIKLDDYGGADEKLVRVLEIEPDEPKSPARLAGLVPSQDFLLGTTATTLSGTDVLAGLLHHHREQVVELYVYNSSTDLVRVVGLHPTYRWGTGDSVLGAAVGTGYLHRLPESCRGTIGRSVERTVRVNPPPATSAPDGPGGHPARLPPHGTLLDESSARMEPTLELELDDDADDDDDGYGAARGTNGGDAGPASVRGMQVQPHKLGTAVAAATTPATTTTATATATATAAAAATPTFSTTKATSRGGSSPSSR